MGHCCSCYSSMHGLQRLKGQGLVSTAVRGESGLAAAATAGTRPTRDSADRGAGTFGETFDPV